MLNLRKAGCQLVGLQHLVRLGVGVYVTPEGLMVPYLKSIGDYAVDVVPVCST